MILGSSELLRLINNPVRGLVDSSINVLEENNQVQPASVDLTLGNEFALIESSTTPRSIFEEDDIRKFTVRDSFIIYPHKFMLATTRETVSLSPEYTAFIEGRSSIGRKGLFIHNAGFIDPGFKGQITLELYNASERPLKIHVGMRICQMIVCKVLGTCSAYDGKYVNQKGVTPSRLSYNFR